MRHALLALVAASAASSFVPGVHAAEPDPPRWKGFNLTSDDGAFDLRLGTQLQVDGYGFPGDEAGTYVDELRVRRFRPSFRATVFEHYTLRWVIDLADSRPVLLDAVIELAHLDALRLRVGKEKAPHSYDHLLSSSVISFMDHGLTTRLSGNRDLGIQLVGVIDKGLVDYQVGIFDGAADSTSIDTDTDDAFELAGRVTVKPFKHAGVAALADLALGVTGSWGEAHATRADQTNTPSYRTNGRATWFRYVAGDDLQTTTIADGERTRIGGHLDWRVGPLGLFGEVLVSSQALRLGDTTADVSNMAWQTYASVVLTGERSSRSGVIPSQVFDPAAGGVGAVELAARVGQLTIDEAAFDAGLADPTRSAESITTLAFAATWYLNAAVKLQLHYERANFEGGASDGDRPAENLVGGRVQLSF